MSFDADDEILQDFLVEAGEILEQLSEQLVDLEQSPDDNDLLNAIFRGFHTVKGGAGFLQLNPLVDCCHAAENVFDTLRNGLRRVNSDLMDVVLQALDSVNVMFDQVRSGQDPDSASPELIEQLHQLALPESATPAAEPEVVEAPVVEAAVEVTPPEVVPEPAVESSIEPTVKAAEVTSTPAGGSDNADISDDEFEQLLSALDDDEEPAATKSAEASQTQTEQPQAEQSQVDASLDDLFDDPAPTGSGGEEITEDEFEALLDQIHGKGKHGGTPAPSEAPASVPDAAVVAPTEAAKDVPKPESASDGDLITDSEFEDLLDRLHGKGKFGSSPAESAPAEATAPAEVSSAQVEAGAAIESQAPAASQPAVSAPAPSAPKAAPAAAPAPSAVVDKVAAGAGSSGGAGKPPQAAAKPKPEGNKDHGSEATVRVDTKRLDDIMNMVGELVLVRNRLVRLGMQSQDETMAKAVANLDVVTGDLQTSVMKTRMQPIKKVFGRFPRVVRDLARQLKKEINLELKGEETDLDKNLVEALADPLVHLVRNSVDHGVESPEERESSGKPRIGNVILAAEQEGDHILLQIQDDGKGMDASVLRTKAVEKGLMDQDAADRLTDQESFNLIFAPGFSTKEQISDVSGRGVGMDVVKTKISQLNGTIKIDSVPGAGTTISIKVPLTLAIMPTLMVMLEDQAFAFPLVNVNEIFHLDLTRTNIVDGQEVVVVRDRPIPLFHLKRWLVRGQVGSSSKDATGHVVVVSVGTRSVGFVVDQLIGQEEVVIKPLGKMLQGTAGMAGATITGDGRIALILDIPSMLNRYAARQMSTAA